MSAGASQTLPMRLVPPYARAGRCAGRPRAGRSGSRRGAAAGPRPCRGAACRRKCAAGAPRRWHAAHSAQRDGCVMDAGCWEPWEGDSRPPAPPPPPIASGEWAGRPSGLARDMSKSLNCSPQGMPPLSILKPAPSAFSTPLAPSGLALLCALPIDCTHAHRWQAASGQLNGERRRRRGRQRARALGGAAVRQPCGGAGPFGRRTEDGEPPARSRATRCARRRAHGRRARRTTRAGRAAAARDGCFVAAWGVGRAQVRVASAQRGARGRPTWRQRSPQARPLKRWPTPGWWVGSWGSLVTSSLLGWPRGGTFLALCTPMVSHAICHMSAPPWARDGFGRFLRFPCMLGTDGAWLHASHALCYRAILLSCVWREFLENRAFRYRGPLEVEPAASSTYYKAEPLLDLGPGLPGRQQKSPAGRQQVARSPGRQWSPVVASKSRQPHPVSAACWQQAITGRQQVARSRVRSPGRQVASGCQS